MGEIARAQVDPNVPLVSLRTEEDQVAGAQGVCWNLRPDPDELVGGARKLYTEYVRVHGHDESGAVDRIFSGAARAVGGSHPVGDLVAEAHLDRIVGR